MILKRNILGLKTIRFFLESWPDTDNLKRHYLFVSILTHEPHPASRFKLRTKLTPIIDIQVGLDKVFDNFSHTTRNEIRRADKISGLRFVALDDNFTDAYRLYCRHEKKQGRPPEKRRAFKGTKLFSAYLNNRMIAAIFCFDSPRWLRAKSISSLRLEETDKEKYKLIGYASRRLVWEICRFGHKLGRAGLDLGGINLKDPAKRGVALFKQSFGPRIIKEYQYIYESPAYQLIRRLKR